MRSRRSSRGGRRTAVALAASVAAAISLLAPGAATAGFQTGFQDDEFVTANTGLRDSLFDRVAAANASVVRINVPWANFVATRPANPTDPADPAYRLGTVDLAVRAAVARGLTPLLMVNNAPAWAEGPNRPPDKPQWQGYPVPGSWKVDARALADFTKALARRYAGNFRDLPRVRHFQIWNEPNLDFWFRPQRKGKRREVSPKRYRKMLNKSYAAIKGVHRSNRVVTAGTAPFGDNRGDERVRPVEFLRKLLCLRKNLKRDCGKRAKFDILAHHPINVLGPPSESAKHRDDATTSDLKRVRRVLRAAERRKTVTKGRHPLWATEIWWETNPPDTDRGRPLEVQARWLQQALYTLWRQGADVVINFQVEDAPYDPADPQRTLQSGVYFANGQPKPSATAWAFPFAADRKGKRKVTAWGKAPVGGQVVIERQTGSGWRKVGKARARAGQVFTDKLRIKGGATLRATVAGQSSLPWRQG